MAYVVAASRLLKGRYLYLDPPDEYKEQKQAPEQAGNQFHTDNENIRRLVIAVAKNQFTVKQLMESVGLKHRPNFLEYSLNPAIHEGFVRMLYPDSPRHPRQKYLLTVKGLGLYNQIR